MPDAVRTDVLLEEFVLQGEQTSSDQRAGAAWALPSYEGAPATSGAQDGAGSSATPGPIARLTAESAVLLWLIIGLAALTWSIFGPPHLYSVPVLLGLSVLVLRMIIVARQNAVAAHPQPWTVGRQLSYPFSAPRRVPGNPRMRARVSAVIPARNEAANLPHVLERLPKGLFEVILVDGQSTDGTADVARALHPGIRVVEQTGRGKGNALMCGFAACRGDIIVMLDADGSTDPAEIPRFVSALLEGAELVKGSRFMQGGGSSDITFLRALGNRVLNTVVNRLFGTRYSDLCYGYAAFWADCLDRLAVDCDGFEVETQMNIRAAKAGLRITEVPSFEAPRIHGVSNLSVTRDGLRVVRTILREQLGSPGSSPAPCLANPVPSLNLWP